MSPRPNITSRHRPPWWPENEEWPPKRWRHMRGRPIFRRMGCFFIIFNFFACVGILAVLQLVLAQYVDLHGIPPLDRPDFILPFGVLGFLIFVGTVYWAVRSLRRMSMPLDDLLEASNKVAEGDYTVRVEPKGPPEIRSMMQGFNSMVERLQENDRQRRAMLADVSHELRTPITVIQGNVEGILDGLYPANEARLKSIVEETQILSRLVDDLRTLSLAESGSLQLKREPTDLGLLIREVVSGFESQSHEKEVRVALELGDVATVEVDPLRFREVMRNLLANALRYTPRQGEVKVGLAESATGGERGVLLFVEDNGPGIDPSDLPHVFERFYKSSDSGGMGLGLSIAKYLVEAHGGRIWAESTVGSRTRISFVLPQTSDV